jgi:hypothetical protein
MHDYVRNVKKKGKHRTMDFLDFTKAKIYGLDTNYYIKSICKSKISTKWAQISETNFFVLATFK